LNETALEGTPTLDDIMTELLPSVRKSLGMEVAFISEFTGELRVFRYVDSTPDFTPLSVGTAGPLDESYCKLVCEGALARIVRNAQDEPAVAHIAATRSLPVGAHLSVPIRFSDGHLYGTFCCFSRSADPTLNERDLSLMNTFADFATRLLERIHLAEAARARIRTRLARIARDSRFEIHYQPLVDIATSRLVGHEALARFNCPIDTSDPADAIDEADLAHRSPDDWFREAMRAGMLESFELAVLRKALGGLPRLPARTYLSMNVSPETILTGQVDALFTGHPLDRLVLEVTEHALVTDYPLIAERLAPLRAAGLRLAVDDAGAGFASFRHILSLEPDIIKLDASLVQHIDLDRGRRALAAALVRFAEEIGSHVAAEGVETAAELQVLRDLGVGEAQGFLLGRPAPLAQENG
jgi:EAL domain-containing protein (putative c-di-GMP-specific phosphodiesterase class I)